MMKALATVIACVLVMLVGVTVASAKPIRSIREWVKGDGKTDDAVGVAKAFDACKGNAFTLQVDCPVLLHIGRDIARPIFVDNGTHVVFAKGGLFIIDNILQPAFVLADTSDVQFLGWNVQYVGGIPIDRRAGGYLKDGVAVADGYPSPVFNDIVVTPWLETHRGVKFTDPAAKHAIWHGPTNLSSVFYLIGDTKQVDIENMRLYVPATAGGNQFIPMAFSLACGYVPNTTAAPGIGVPGNWVGVPGIAVPSQLTFKNITLDGYYMGFQGTSHQSTFTNITGLRYGDLQDADGGNIGGVEKWFAPPHLFYFNGPRESPYDPVLSNQNITIAHVRDIGPRVGKARDTSPLKRSGYANSLKIGAVDSSVTDYESNRPDGLLDVLSCRNMTLAVIKGTYDSSFLNDLYPGVRFPSGDYYQSLTMRNVTLTDTSPTPYATSTDKLPLPFSGARGANNSNIVFDNVVVNLKSWTRPVIQPEYSGLGNKTSIKFNIGP